MKLFECRNCSQVLYFENTDCAPSSYVVSVKALTPGAPKPQPEVAVNGQNGVTLTGLFPATNYQLSVAAVINKVSTSSPR